MMFNTSLAALSHPKSATELALEFIHSSDETFYLTGSRAFSRFPNDAMLGDYDFFVQAQGVNTTQLLLEKAGFKKISRSDYTGACEVLHVYELGQVHVQIVADATKKMCIQNAILKNFQHSFNSVEKPVRTLIWRAMYEVAY